MPSKGVSAESEDEIPASIDDMRQLRGDLESALATDRLSSNRVLTIDAPPASSHRSQALEQRRDELEDRAKLPDGSRT